MIDIASMDLELLRALRGLDVFDATFHANDAAEPVECLVARDTLEIPDEYGTQMIRSGAALTYLRGQVGDPPLESWFEFDDARWVVDSKVPSQDSSMRVVHCRKEPLP